MKKFNFQILIIILLSCSFPLISVAQSRDTIWSVHGNHIDSCGRLGSNNYKDVKIVTDSVTRMLISKDGYIQVQNDLIVPNGKIGTDSIIGIEGGDVNVITNLNVNGALKADSLMSTSGNIGLNGNLNMPNNWIHTDSLRCRAIHVGDSSIFIGNSGPYGTANTISTTSQVPLSKSTLAIAPYNGVTYFGTGAGSYIANVGIGIAIPSANLHINQADHFLGTHIGVSELFTNSGSTTGNGFSIGITGGTGSASNIAFLNQKENKPMNFYTDKIQRMSIGGNGNIGIGSDPSGAEKIFVNSYEPIGISVYNLHSATVGQQGNIGIVSSAYSDSVSVNYGIIASAIGSNFNTTVQTYNVGIEGQANSGYENIGVNGSAYGGAYNYAGYFDGDVAYTGTLIPLSDSILKVNVQSFTGDSALIYIRNLKPKTYEFDESMA